MYPKMRMRNEGFSEFRWPEIRTITDDLLDRNYIFIDSYIATSFQGKAENDYVMPAT